MTTQDAIVAYLRNWSAGLIEVAITDFCTPEGISRLSGTARAIDGIATHIENGDYHGEDLEDD